MKIEITLEKRVGRSPSRRDIAAHAIQRVAEMVCRGDMAGPLFVNGDFVGSFTAYNAK